MNVEMSSIMVHDSCGLSTLNAGTSPIGTMNSAQAPEYKASLLQVKQYFSRKCPFCFHQKVAVTTASAMTSSMSFRSEAQKMLSELELAIFTDRS